MRKRNYRAGVSAVLVGAVLFSPLLCGMTCLETGVGNSRATAQVGPAGELAGEFAVNVAVGCVLTHVVLEIDLSGWEDVLNDGNWVWAWLGVGVEVVELVRGVSREGLLWM
jgi:hypothetical protein